MATQVGAWIWYTAIAVAVMVAIFGAAMTLGLVNLGQGFGNHVAIEAVILVASVAAALVMVPAVQKLTPRG